MYHLLKSLLLLAILIASVLLLSCSKEKSLTINNPDGGVANNRFMVEGSFSHELGLTGQLRLRLEAINGPVRITGTNNSHAVQVSGKRQVFSESTADAQENLSRLEVEVSRVGDEILVQTFQPQETFGRNYVVDYTITVPRDFEIVVNNLNGEMILESLDNTVSITQTNGEVTLRDISGSTYLDLVNGQIDGEITLPTNGIIDWQTVNGQIDLAIPANTSAEFSAKVSNGTINFSNLQLRNEESTNRSLKGTLAGGEGTISLVSDNGTIKVTGF